jgi:hypothetical protein
VTFARTGPASAGIRSSFVSWADGTVSNTRTITVGIAAAAYTATFKNQFLLTDLPSDFSLGTLTNNPSTADQFYDSDTTVQLTASPAPGARFISYSGDLSGTSNTASIVMDRPRNITAHFDLTTPTVCGATISPTTIPSGTPTLVTVTVTVCDPSLIPNSLNLLQITSTATDTLGSLHDDGQNGDVQAGDGIYTIQITINQPAGSSVQLEVSEAFLGVLRRGVVTLPTTIVEDPNAPQQVIHKLITALQNGDIPSAVQAFAPSQTTTDLLTNLSPSMRLALASAFATATLKQSTTNYRVFGTQWIESDGSTTPVDFWMVPSSSGSWVISNW